MKTIILLLLSFSLWAQKNKNNDGPCKMKYSSSIIDETTTIKYSNIWRAGLTFEATISKKDTVYFLDFGFLALDEDKPYLDTLDFKLLSKDKIKHSVKCQVERTSAYRFKCGLQKPDMDYFLNKEIVYFKIAKSEASTSDMFASKFIPQIRLAIGCVNKELKLEGSITNKP